MTYDPFSHPRPGRYVRRSPEFWAQVRADYLAGATGSELCDRYGVGRSALRERARDEGWRRQDQPHPELSPVSEARGFDPDEEPAGAGELATRAWARLSHAVRAGRLGEALRWERLFRQLQKHAGEEAAIMAESLEEARAQVAARADPDTSPLPLHGGEAGRGGGGMTCAVALGDSPRDVSEPDQRGSASTPIPDPSPIEGEGSNPDNPDSVFPPPYRPTGPTLPSHPPAWVCARLGIAARE